MKRIPTRTSPFTWRALLRRPIAIAAILITSTALLAGCGKDGGLDMAGLSGSGAMQIDVEVYKGPLSKEYEIQKAELKGVLLDGQKAFHVLKGNIEISLRRLGCFTQKADKTNKSFLPWDNTRDYEWAPPKEFDELGWFYKMEKDAAGKEKIAESVTIKDETYTPRPFIGHRNPKKDGKYKICPILQNIWAEVVFFGAATEKLTDASINKTNKALKIDNIYDGDPLNFRVSVARLAETMRGRARFWATEHAAISPNEGRVRVEMADVTNFLADYGNRLGARADALQKQNYGSTSKLAKLLSTTSYLRDSSTTDYLNLYDWNDASVDRPGASATDRVRLVEQLVADTYWTNINRVFASGQGEVRMAFIKDDIGNWNLKRFENDPTKLVEAYRDAGLAVVKQVAEFATDPSGTGDKLLGFANRISSGSAPPADVNTAVKGLHGQAKEQISAIGESQAQRANVLSEKIETQNSELENGGLMKAASDAATETKNRNKTLEEAEGVEREKEADLSELQKTDQPENADIEAAWNAILLAQSNVKVAKLEVEKAETDQAIKEKALADANLEIAALKRDKERIGPETVRLIRQVLTTHSGAIDQLQKTTVK